MTGLPDSWTVAKLGEVMDVQGGSQPPKSNFKYEPEEGFVRLLQIRDFGAKPVPTYVPRELVSKFCEKNDVLIARYGASLGRILTGMQGAYNVALAKTIYSEELLFHRYIFWLLKTDVLQTPLRMISRSAQNGFARHEIAHVELPIPPLNEQRRIVEKIEAMFEEIDAGTQSLRTAQAKLGLYRQSLLKSAFEGRLTADWRAQNPDQLEDPETLPSRIQSERDTRYKAALDDWQKALLQWREDGEQGKKPAKPKRPRDLDPTSEITLGHVVLDVAQGWSPKCENHASTADDIWGVIKTTAIQAAKFLSEENKELPDSLQPRKWLELQKGDVIITRAGPRTRVGVACMVKKTRPKLMLCDKAYRLNYLETMVLPEFLEGYLNAPNTQKRIEVIKSGINDSGLNLKQDQFLALNFWLPSIAEQAEIVRILDAKLEAADALEAEITAALTRASALRQSILKKAFSGRLVPQDPTDEPASALLDRIKADRAAAPKAKRTRKTSA